MEEASVTPGGGKPPISDVRWSRPPSHNTGETVTAYTRGFLWGFHFYPNFTDHCLVEFEAGKQDTAIFRVLSAFMVQNTGHNFFCNFSAGCPWTSDICTAFKHSHLILNLPTQKYKIPFQLAFLPRPFILLDPISEWHCFPPFSDSRLLYAYKNATFRYQFTISKSFY